MQPDPYPFYAALRADAPVAYVESLQAYAVSRHADVRRVMHDHETFSSEAMAALVSRPAEYAAELRSDASMLPVSIVGADGDTHTRLRLIVNRAFTPKRIGMIEDDVRRVARGFVDALVAGESGDVQAGLAVPLPTIVIAAMLGVPAERRDDFRRWSEDMVRGVFEPLDGAGQAQVSQSGDEMGELLDEVIAARSQRYAGDDMISLLLRAEAGQGALTHDEMKVFVFTLLVAGSITTAYLIGTTAQMLADDPELLRPSAGRCDTRARRGDAALRHAGPADVPNRDDRGRDRGYDDSARRDRARPARLGQPRTRTCSPNPIASIPTATRPSTSRSATASTSASAPHSPAWKRRRPSRSCCPVSAPRADRRRPTGDLARIPRTIPSPCADLLARPRPAVRPDRREHRWLPCPRVGRFVRASGRPIGTFMLVHGLGRSGRDTAPDAAGEHGYRRFLRSGPATASFGRD